LTIILDEHAQRVSDERSDPVFPGDLGRYWYAKHRLDTAVKRAKLAHTTLHELRHTFGVHCAQAGVPLPRIQKLMGHASPIMTMRYMKHAPEAYFAEDAARIASSLAKPSQQRETPDAIEASVLRLA
jgi:integrase